MNQKYEQKMQGNEPKIWAMNRKKEQGNELKKD